MGRLRYPRARCLLTCADSGGSNGYRLQLWKPELQAVATEQSLTITVCHFPPGTGKWNKIEYRLFFFTTTNWRGPTVDRLSYHLSLVAGKKTQVGLTVKACLDRRIYKRGIKVSVYETKTLELEPHPLPRRVELHHHTTTVFGVTAQAIISQTLKPKDQDQRRALRRRRSPRYRPFGGNSPQKKRRPAVSGRPPHRLGSPQALRTRGAALAARLCRNRAHREAAG